MRNRGQLILGGLILVWGVLLLIGNIFDINIGALCWPTALILVGLWLLFRPRLTLPGTSIRIRPFGDVDRYGEWEVRNEEIWMFVGNIRLDLSRAHLMEGLTTIHILAFVGDIKLLAPEDVGVALTSSAFVTDSKFLGRKRDSFLTTVHETSPDYENAPRKLALETTCFVADVKVDIV